MNKILTIATIALIAVVMGMSVVAPAMAATTWKPCHTDGVREQSCVTGQPDQCLTETTSFVWFNDLNNNNVQDGRELKGCFELGDNPNIPRK